LVGVGRAMLSNPDFARKVRGGIEIAAFDRQYIRSLV
jgi:2,4-dienoyl-CoA reductase-like NADH-dependent reductase (Old Yellow Enzyme family)